MQLSYKKTNLFNWICYFNHFVVIAYDSMKYTYSKENEGKQEIKEANNVLTGLTLGLILSQRIQGRTDLHKYLCM